VLHRKFLLGFSLYFRLRAVKRRLRASQRTVAQNKEAHEKELISIRGHFERLLAEERLKVQTLALQIADTACMANKLPCVSHTVANLSEEAERIVDPTYKPPEPNLEDTLLGDEYDYFLDQKDGFWEAERSNGRSEAEIAKLWNDTFKFEAIRQAKEQILR
jgi:hypothetical protein